MSSTRIYTALLQYAKQHRLWAVAYFATLLLPLGLIFVRSIADGACVVIGLSFLVYSAQHKQWQWLRDPVVRAGGLAWCWLVLVVTPLAVAPMDSLSVSAPWIRYVLLYAALRHFVLQVPQALRFLVNMLSVMLVLVAIDTLWQYVTGVSLTGHVRDPMGRLSGPMTNVKVGIFSAKMLVPTAAIALFFAMTNASCSAIWRILLMVLLVVTTILVSGERAAFIYSFVVVSLTLLFMGFSEPTLRKKLCMTFAFLLALVAITFVTQSWVQQRTEELRVMLVDYPNSEYGKLALAGYKIGVQHLLHGVGFKCFRVECLELLAQNAVAACNLHPHNIYLEWFSEAGVVGVLLLLNIIIAFFITAIKSFALARGMHRILPAVAIAVLLIVFAPFMPSQSSYSNWPSLLFWYSTALLFASLNFSLPNYQPTPSNVSLPSDDASEKRQ